MSQAIGIRAGERGSDQQLMSEVSAGSVEAFARLYDRFCQRAFRVAQAICRDESRAQDAVQEAFVSVWSSRTSYTAARGTVAGWLLTVVRHRAVDLARSNGRHVAHGAGFEQLDEHPAPVDICAAVTERDAAAHLRALMTRLPDEQREVIVLAYYGQLTHSEIATQLGLPPGTVKGRMRLGLEKLRAGMVMPRPAPRSALVSGSAQRVAGCHATSTSSVLVSDTDAAPSAAG